LGNSDHSQIRSSIIKNGLESSGGISIYAGINILVESNQIEEFKSTSSSGIYLQSDLQNFTIRNNLIQNNWWGIRGWSAINGTIFNNTILNSTQYGIYFESSGIQNSTITNNTIMYNTANGIVFHNSDWNNITHNQILNNGDSIYLSFSDYNRITNNTIKNNTNNAIYESSSTGNILINNNYLTPTVSWISNRTTIYQNEFIQFTSNATGDMPITYYWTFGDGGTASNANPIYTYPNIGTYYVNLNIVDNDGEIASYNNWITVLDMPEFWNGPIHITGTNWTLWKVNYPEIVNGSGTQANPFIIRNVVVNAQGANYGIYIQDSNTSTYFVVENCTIFNEVMNGAIYIQNSYNGIIQQNEIYQCYYGIRVSASSNYDTKITIRNNVIHGLGANGVYLYQASNNTIDNNMIYDNNSNGISVVTALSKNNTISNNHIRGNRYYSLYIEWAELTNVINNTLIGSSNDDPNINLYFAQNTLIFNNTILNSSKQAILCYETNNTIIRNVNIDKGMANTTYAGIIAIWNSHNTLIEESLIENGYNGIWADSGKNLTIRNNKLSNTLNSQIKISIVDQVLIENNELRNGEGNGIHLNYCTNASVLSNLIENFSIQALVIDADTRDFQIRDNNITQNENGIRILGAINGTIMFNNISNNDNTAIWIANFADLSLQNSTISNNTINHNVGPGILLYLGFNVTITFNNASYNQYGLHITSSNNCVVQNNTFQHSLIEPIGAVGTFSNTYIQYNNLYMPSVNWTTNATAYIVNTPIQFTSNVTGDWPIVYLWTFQDGVTSSEENPIHSFLSIGTYSVELRITDADGEIAILVRNITVQLDIQVYAAYFTNISGILYTGTYLQFLNSTLQGNAPFTFNWNFGDGTPNSTEAQPIHQFNNAGEFFILCTITDADDDVGFWNFTVQIIEDLFPIAVIATNGTVFFTTDWIEFNMNSATVVSGNQPLTITWIFNDSQNTTTVNNYTAIHRYSQPGTYIVILNVTDSDGDTALANISITIEYDTFPDARFTWVPDSNIYPGTNITFHIVNTAAGNAPFQYQWNFGDGTGNSTESTPIHSYLVQGNYTVTLTITDRNGDVHVYSAVIQVNLNSETPPENFLENLLQQPWALP
jgi:parallel beta-helix repeat protein